MSSLVLTADEVKELTGRTRPAYQARELDFLKIPYKRRSDGTVCVFRADCRSVPSEPETKKRAPQLRLT